MHIQVQNLNNIKLKIKDDSTLKKLKIKIPNIIAISKTFSSEDVLPLIEHGHIHFGENKVQEAENKWQTIKNKYSHLKLHMVGKLQSNKAKNAVQLFDYIHSLDSKKLANKIFNFENKLNKKLKYFIQVNLAKESQKSGISIQDLESFYKFCTQEISLDVIGLMCIPPINTSSEKYFSQLNKLSRDLNINELSMGMSEDYLAAVKFESTFLRLGSSIFGKRKS